MNRKKGFTLVELIVVLVVVAIIVAISIPVGIGYVRIGQERSNDNIARSLYLAAQNALTDMRTRGELSELAEFSPDGTLVGGHLYTNATGTSGKLNTTWVPVPEDTKNAPFLYYMTLSGSAGGADDAMLLELLDPYVVDKNVLEQAIVIELNAKTGVVKSAFYSEQFDDFFYDGTSDEPNNAARNRVSTWQMGFYGVETTGSPVLPPVPLKIQLLDEQNAAGLKNALYVEAWVGDIGEEDRFTLSVTDKAGTVLQGGGKDVAVTFATNGAGGITAHSLNDAMAAQYRDLVPEDHAGGIVTPLGDHEHIMYTDTALSDPFGTGVASYRKVTWVIDIVDAGDDAYPSLLNSIGSKYPDIKMQDIRVRVSQDAFPSNSEVSLPENSHYATVQLGGTRVVRTARHLNNVRYTALGQEAAPPSFSQTSDIDLSGVKNFAPLNWLPGAAPTAFETSNTLSAVYNAAKTSSQGYSIYALRMLNTNTTAEDYGLFGTLGTGAQVRALGIQNAQVYSTKSNNVGAFAGGMEGDSLVRQCFSYANVMAPGTGGGPDCGVGGLVGRMDGTSELTLSYNGGYYDAGETAPSTSYFGSVQLGGGAALSGNLYVGGLVGNVASSGAKLNNCYNNARVNIESVTYVSDPDDPDAFLSKDPVFTPLAHTNYAKVYTGGIAGANAGTVQKVYTTNFVATYSSGGTESNSAMLAGKNTGTVNAATSFSLRGNLPTTVGAQADGLVVKDDLALKNTALQNAWLKGSGYETQTPPLPLANSWEAEKYPYPTLRSNKHVTKWEDIKDNSIELAWATFTNNKRDTMGEYYKEVMLETRDNFYRYQTTEMQLTLSWDNTKYDLDDSRVPALGNAVTTSGNTSSLTTTITNGAIYELRFYNRPSNQTRTDAAVTIQCTVPGGATGMPNYSLVLVG